MREITVKVTVPYDMTALLKSFPCVRLRLKDSDGLQPFDPEKLDKISGKLSTGELAAVQFALAVYNTSVEWKAGRFDAVRALSTWDAGNRLAFVSWAANPWRP